MNMMQLEPFNDHAAAALHEVEVQIDELYLPLVNPDILETVARRTLARHCPAPAALTVVVTSDSAVQTLNRTYRGIDAPTDVLSFAAHDAEDESDEEGDAGRVHLVTPAELADELADYLGDIVIALPYATRQAAHYGNSVDNELRLLTVHGVLHLLGYDHATPEEDDAMWEMQSAVLRTVTVPGLSRRVFED
jgi:probable rRNA maturation factor